MEWYDRVLAKRDDVIPSFVNVDAVNSYVDKSMQLDQPEMTGTETAADIALGFAPGIGTAMGFRDFERARRADDKLGMGLGILSMIPVAGGAVRAAGKGVNRIIDELDMSHSVDYRGWHTAPTREGSNSIDDLADIYPDDIYSNKGVQYYGTGDRTMDTKAIDTIKRMQGNPDAEITIYRAAPKGVKGINSGDWVTINKDYAKMHGDAWVEDGSYDIISQKVKAKDIVTNGDSIHEWGYHPVKAK